MLVGLAFDLPDRSLSGGESEASGPVIDSADAGRQSGKPGCPGLQHKGFTVRAHRKQKLEILPVIEGLLQAGFRRNLLCVQQGPHRAALQDVPQIRGQTVADVHHGADAARFPQKDPLLHPRNKIQVPSRSASAQRTRDIDAVTRPGAGTQECAAGRQGARPEDMHRQLRSMGHVAANDRSAEPAAERIHPCIDSIDDRDVQIGRRSDIDEQPLRLRTHGGHIAQHPPRRLVPDPRRVFPRFKMHILDNRIRGKHLIAATSGQPYHRAIIPGSLHQVAMFAETSGQAPDDFVFPDIHQFFHVPQSSGQKRGDNPYVLRSPPNRLVLPVDSAMAYGMKLRFILIGIIVSCVLPVALPAERERPKIGVVLGGGGALGFAHIGVLKVLEEQRIPIDYIAGTSMGAIVAGMYASGMSPGEIERQFASLDWWDVLKDKSPPQYLTYRRKVEYKRFMDLEFGFADGGIAFAPGMAYGQKLNNLLSTFSINSAGINDFDTLNIPYRAVATDLRSGESKVLGRGNLATVMRASMAVPGIFTPVELDDMVLVDGGVLDNIPVDAVLDMGADVVIAVDVGASAALESELSDYNTLGEVVSRTYTIVQRPDQERQLALADVVIEPELNEASASQFHRSTAIIPAGQKAATAHLGELKAYSVDPASYAAYLQRQRHRRTGSIQIASIRTDIGTAAPESAVRRRIRTRPGPMDLETIYEDLNRIHGMGLFQTVTYELAPLEGGDFELVYHAREKFWGPHYLHFGMKAETASDTSLIWSLLFNYLRTQLNPLGGELTLELEGGGNIRRIETEWYQPVVPSGRYFLAPSLLMYSRDQEYYIDNLVVAEIQENFAAARFDAGISAGEFGEFRIGTLIAGARADGNSGAIPLGVEKDTVVAGTAQLALDQLDDPVFPTRGFLLEAEGLFANEEFGSDRTFSTVELSGALPLSLGRHTLTSRLSAGSSLGTELPFFALFDVGGVDMFAGYAPYQLYGYYYGVGQVEYRYRVGKLPPTLGRSIYAILRMDAGNAWIEAEEIDLQDISYGGLAEVAAETVVGTCRLSVGKAEGLHPRFYFSIGNHF